MEIQLKTEQITKIIALIPKAFHATGLSAKVPNNGAPVDLKMYFADTAKELMVEDFSQLPYVQFKYDRGAKSKINFKPSFNSLEGAYNYCIIGSSRAGAMSADVVLYYEGA